MADKVKDPVCGMEIDKSDAVTLEKDGRTQYFCSDKCKNEFQNSGASVSGEHDAGGGSMADTAGTPVAPGPATGTVAGTIIKPTTRRWLRISVGASGFQRSLPFRC